MKTVFIGIALLLAATFVAACHESEAVKLRRLAAESHSGAKAAPEPSPLPLAPAEAVRLATLEDKRVNESSGLVASRRTPGIFWTHNDSGDGPIVYAFDREGRSRATFRVEGASAIDWEDIAAGPGPDSGPYLYAGDIGDNERKRESITVYRFPEPTAAAAPEAPSAPRPTQPAEVIRLRYPDGPHDAEALLVHPTTGDIYIVTKAVDGAGVYKLAARDFNPKAVGLLARVGVLRGPDFFGTLVTGGDISPDGRRVALCDYAQGYELTLPEGSTNFDDIWRQAPVAITLGPRIQGESVCYRLDGAALLATSERTPTPLFEVALPSKGVKSRKP